MLLSSYSPTSLNVARGTTVDFVNSSAIAHTVNFDGTRPPGVSDVPLNNGGNFPRQFNDVGTFNFHCTEHVGMNGLVRVQ